MTWIFRWLWRKAILVRVVGGNTVVSRSKEELQREGNCLASEQKLWAQLSHPKHFTANALAVNTCYSLSWVNTPLYSEIRILVIPVPQHFVNVSTPFFYLLKVPFSTPNFQQIVLFAVPRVCLRMIFFFLILSLIWVKKSNVLFLRRQLGELHSFLLFDKNKFWKALRC